MPPLATPSRTTCRIIPCIALVSHDRRDREPPGTDARFAFYARRGNRCFPAGSQVRTHARFEGHRPGEGQ